MRSATVESSANSILSPSTNAITQVESDTSTDEIAMNTLPDAYSARSTPAGSQSNQSSRSSSKRRLRKKAVRASKNAGRGTWHTRAEAGKSDYEIENNVPRIPCLSKGSFLLLPRSSIVVWMAWTCWTLYGTPDVCRFLWATVAWRNFLTKYWLPWSYFVLVSNMVWDTRMALVKW